MINIVAWSYLLLAIGTEVAGTIAMKLALGFTVLTPSILIFVFYGLSLIFLTLSLKYFSISFAYAVWSGLGTLLIYAISILLFNEHIDLLKAMGIILIIVGVTGLKQE